MSLVPTVKMPPSAVLNITFSGYSQEEVSRLSRDEILELLQNRMVLKDGLASVEKKSYEVDEPITEFTNFGQLPAELHLKIWKLNLPGPRMIEVKPGSRSKYVGTNDPITNLAVCRDSRYEALKVYELAFPSNLSPAQIYVNFAIDRIFLGVRILIDTSGRLAPLADSFARIRFLALNKVAAQQLNLHSLKCLPNLQELTLIEDGRHRKSFNHKKRICAMLLKESIHLMPRWWTASSKSIEDLYLSHLGNRARHPEDYANHLYPRALKVSCARIELEYQAHDLKIRRPVLRNQSWGY